MKFMENIKEDKTCYASQEQREVLINLVTNPAIEEKFFLTGGTALSVFYLYHRVSNDLDLFTVQSIDLGEIDFWIKTRWPKDSTKIRMSPQFLSLLIKDVKVDFVIDPLSINEHRTKFMFENGHYVSVDTITNIVSNKFCAVISRVEPKDFVDFYMLIKTFPGFRIEDIYKLSKLKDAVFDDPPTVAFQLETGVEFIKENPVVMPQLYKQIDLEDFFDFYKKVAAWLYRLL